VLGGPPFFGFPIRTTNSRENTCCSLCISWRSRYSKSRPFVVYNFLFDSTYLFLCLSSSAPVCVPSPALPHTTRRQTLRATLCIIPRGISRIRRSRNDHTLYGRVRWREMPWQRMRHINLHCIILLWNLK